MWDRLGAYPDIHTGYSRLWPSTSTLLTDASGRIVSGWDTFGCSACGLTTALTSRLVEESLRWGEPAVGMCPQDHYLWAVPLTDNNRLSGGIIGCFTGSGAGSVPAPEVHTAAYDLLRTVLSHNAVNEALMRDNRRLAETEAGRASAIHGLKECMYSSIREVYMTEEENLRSAIRSRDRKVAREVLNRILVGVYNMGSSDMELLKAVVLEFVIIIYRAAVEAGGDPMEMLGLNYGSYLSLFRIRDDAGLTHWLVRHVEGIMDCLRFVPDRTFNPKANAVASYVKEHYAGGISRESVADELGISPSHLSHIIRDQLGTTFKDLLIDARINKAKELLRDKGMGLAQVAQETGFPDQSYFTKVFRSRVGMTPKEYRG